MTRYPISFSSTAMDVPDEEIPDVARDGHAVIQEAKCWRVYLQRRAERRRGARPGA